MPDTPADIEILRDLDLFRATPPEIVAAIARALHVHRVESGARVVEKGDSGDRMYIIRSGRVKVHDEDIIVAVLERGELFGEFSIIDNEPRSMDVTAIEKTELLTIDRNDFLNILRSSAEAPLGIMTMLVKRLREQTASKIALFKVREEELKRLVAEGTADLRERNNELAQALARLTATQEQLLHAEKLASLGQLTAGIAHEIQNPLNFVNNFSELTTELIDDTQRGLLADPLLNDAEKLTELKAILDEIKRNSDRIREHGKRADRIIKGMLLHLRSGPVELHPTDLNAMIEKDMNLAYQGWRARDNTFVASFRATFDPAVGEVSVVPQDISRVVVNLLDNAMYAVRERGRAGEEGYAPSIELSTARGENTVVITIRDNGTGIPESMREKLFHPFTTTKPTGEGTGLGLSISYEIITKGHRGSVTVESIPNSHTEFIITLPTE